MTILLKYIWNWLCGIFASPGAESLSVGRTDPILTPDVETRAESSRPAAPPISAARMVQLANAHDQRRAVEADDAYEAFVAAGYETFLAWIAIQIEAQSSTGNRGVSLSFDHWRAEVDADEVSFTHLISRSDIDPAMMVTNYRLPFTGTPTMQRELIGRVVHAITDHFTKLQFDVSVSTDEGRFTLSGKYDYGPTTTVYIFWISAQAEHRLSGTGGIPVAHKVSTVPFAIAAGDPSYQTVQFGEYEYGLRKEAESLFQLTRVQISVGA